jgi:hypothetical protein
MNHRNYRDARRSCLATLLLAAAVPAMALPNGVASVLKRHTGFTDEQLAAVRRGDRVVRMLETQSQTEVAFVGVTRLPIPFRTYLDRMRAGTLYRTGDTLIQFGRFAENPTMADLKNLHLESYDLRPQGSSADAVRAATEKSKETLISAIANYEKDGALFVGPLGEQLRPIDQSKDFEPLVRQAGYLRECLPPAYDYLIHYPKFPSRGSDDFFVWKQLTFGFRPLTRVAQVSMWEYTVEAQQAIVLIKQIYANRYFRASFQIDHLVSDESDPKHPAVYLISLNYGRSELLEGLPGKLIRPIVLSRTQAAAEKTLDQARRDLQLEFVRDRAIAHARAH